MSIYNSVHSTDTNVSLLNKESRSNSLCNNVTRKLGCNHIQSSNSNIEIPISGYVRTQRDSLLALNHVPVELCAIPTIALLSLVQTLVIRVKLLIRGIIDGYGERIGQTSCLSSIHMLKPTFAFSSCKDLANQVPSYL